MIDKCPSWDYNCTYTMVEAANVISTAPETATAGARKGLSPKDGFLRQKKPLLGRCRICSGLSSCGWCASMGRNDLCALCL